MENMKFYNLYIRILAVYLSVFFLQACVTNKKMSDYIVPDFPGPITMDGGTVKVSPVIVDDYITNPGIGWQDGPEPFGILGFPETVDYSYRRKISWAILNPIEETYDWTALDQQLEEAKSSGKQFSFRVYTMVGEGYEGHVMPDWVLIKGASLFPNGEPDYSNCVYQEEWGEFVNELVRTYDGNSDIAFIDISGYGNFNEWAWQDQQTEWDGAWEDYVESGDMLPQDHFMTLDGQARRRLADMFIGGEYREHQCQNADGSISEVYYSYDGFRETQLLMPYAGIVQSSEYVFARRKDVGFRYDCLGLRGKYVFDKTNSILRDVWRTAPVAFELCKPEDVEVEDVGWLLENAHGSIVHNNNWAYDLDTLSNVMKYAGYRYFLQEAEFHVEKKNINIRMFWKNIGFAPSYPKMGQEFILKFHILNDWGEPVYSTELPAEIPSWMPSATLPAESSSYAISYSIVLPSDVEKGEYLAAIELLDTRTEKPLLLAMGGRDKNGLYVLSPLEIK